MDTVITPGLINSFIENPEPYLMLVPIYLIYRICMAALIRNEKKE